MALDRDHRPSSSTLSIALEIDFFNLSTKSSISDFVIIKAGERTQMWYIGLIINPSFRDSSSILDPIALSKIKGFCSHSWYRIPLILTFPFFGQLKITVAWFSHVNNKYYNVESKAIKKPLSGFLSRLYQHELLHLEGKLMIEDAMNNIQILDLTNEKYSKLIIQLNEYINN